MNKKYLYIILTVVLFIFLAIAAYILFVPGPDDIVNEYIMAWENNDYNKMYSYFSTESKEKISLDEFKNTYNNFYDKLNLNKKSFKRLVVKQEGFFDAQAKYEKKLNSHDFGEKIYKYEMSLERKGLINWKIKWDYDLIIPELSSDKKFVRKRVLPERGEIFDRSGEPLAIKGDAVIVGIQPSRIKNRDTLVEKMSNILEVREQMISSEINKYPDHPDWLVPIKTMTVEKYRLLESELRPIPGVVFRKKEARIYPEGKSTAHIIGYTGEVTENWIKNNQDLDYRSGDIVGRAGIEKSYEKKLRGKCGYILYLEDDNGDKNKLMDKPVVHGGDIYLTIDLKYQNKARKILGEQKGAIVLVSPQNNTVLAMVSSPSYDPNLFSLGISRSDWNRLKGDKDNPLLNRAIQGLYAPGSVFKMITASAALSTERFDLETSFNDTGEYKVKGNIIKNYQNNIYEEHKFSEALIHSINTTFAKIGNQLGKEKIINQAEKFGIGKRIDFPLPVKKSSLGNIIDEVDLAWTALGQGEVAVTPLQIVKIITTIARDGKEANINLIKNTENIAKNNEVIIEDSQQVISKNIAREMQKVMTKVVEKGTAKNAKVENQKIAGKTGTAEIDSKSEKTHAWFTAFTPVKNPSFAAVIFLEEGGVGGKNAAPLFKKLIFDKSY